MGAIVSKVAIPGYRSNTTENDLRQLGLKTMWLDEASQRDSMPGRGVFVVQYESPMPGKQNVIVFTHGNMEDVSSVVQFCHTFACKIPCVVIAWEYPRYGLDKREDISFEDRITIVAKYIRIHYAALDIIPYGRSLGSTFAIMMAIELKQHARMLILEAPFATILSTVNVNMAKLFKWADICDNLTLLRQLSIPLLVLHGTKDDIVPIGNSKLLLKEYTGHKCLLEISDASHNSVLGIGNNRLLEMYNVYCTML